MKGTITAWLRTGITAREGDIVTASMIYTRPPRQLTAKQAKRMRELRRRGLEKLDRQLVNIVAQINHWHPMLHAVTNVGTADADTISLVNAALMSDLVVDAVVAKGPIVPPTDAPLPTKGTSNA